uniref:Uncharacterized protein n=1 Tax=Ixodes scapularis TaxID=6945 RepID=A0A4D5RCW7_IXOSC
MSSRQFLVFSSTTASSSRAKASEPTRTIRTLSRRSRLNQRQPHCLVNLFIFGQTYFLVSLCASCWVSQPGTLASRRKP